MSNGAVPEQAEAIDGVWSIALPFPNPLRHTFCHLMRVPDGVVAVDIGWDSDECWDALLAGLSAAGFGLDDLVGAVITHLHPDHYGLAARIRAHSSAWLAMHPFERALVGRVEADRDQHLEKMAAWLRSCGAPASEFAELHADNDDLRNRMSLVQPDRDLADGDAVPGTGGAVRAVHTPGHTPGHLCFHDRERNLLYTGDHILPRVTPNISRRPTSDPDPLADFVSSIDKVRPYAGARVLPGHEWAFGGLDGRLDELLAHHEERLDQIEAAVREGAGTVWEVACRAPWARPFDTLQGRARRSAMGEAYSHLLRLAALGRITYTPGQPERFGAANGSRPGSVPAAGSAAG